MISYTKQFALVASLLIAVPAVAQELPERTVETAGLNLASPEGREALDNRLEYAAKLVCAVGQSRELASRMNAAKCFNETIAIARRDAETLVAQRLGTRLNVAAR
jgi:UrcA family protein